MRLAASLRRRAWLAVQPGIGLAFEWHVVGPNQGNDDSLKGMPLDPAIPCEKSTWMPHAEDLRYIVASGQAGSGGFVSADNPLGMEINPKDPTGSIDAVINHLIPLGYFVPPESFSSARTTKPGRSGPCRARLLP